MLEAATVRFGDTLAQREYPGDALCLARLAGLNQRRSRNLLWQLMRKRVAQVAVGMLFVSTFGPGDSLLQDSENGWVFCTAH